MKIYPLSVRKRKARLKFGLARVKDVKLDSGCETRTPINSDFNNQNCDSGARTYFDIKLLDWLRANVNKIVMIGVQAI